MSAHEFEFRSIDGGTIHMSEFAGNPVLLVNVASECGYTPQYEHLQQLWERYRDDGLIVLGVPSNDFGAQEPGTEAEIQGFCETRFGVDFPMTAKQQVVGGDAHPLYRWIAAELGEGAAPRWNFHKYLINPEGGLAATWPSAVDPLDDEVTQAVDAALGKLD